MTTGDYPVNVPAAYGIYFYEGEAISDSIASFGIGDNYPAYHLNWHMAADFANAVTAQHNLIHGTGLESVLLCSYTADPAVYCSVFLSSLLLRWISAADGSRMGICRSFWSLRSLLEH